MSGLIKIIATNIRNIRKYKNLTQENLAEICGLHTSYLAGVERGERNFTIQTLEKIAEGLDVTPIELLKLRDNNLEENFFEKREKINILTNVINDFNEQDIDRLITIIQEIKNMQK